MKENIEIGPNKIIKGNPVNIYGNGNNIPSHSNPVPCPPKKNGNKIFNKIGAEVIENDNEIILIISGHGGFVKDIHKFYEYIKSFKKPIIAKFKSDKL